MAQTDTTGQLSWLLDNLVDQVEHVQQALILSRGGLMVAASPGLSPATSDRMPEHFRPGPEHRRLLSLCRRPTPIVDLTSEIDLPLGVVRVLLGDLISEGLVGVLSTQKQPATDQRLLRMVLDGLESL